MRITLGRQVRNERRPIKAMIGAPYQYKFIDKKCLLEGRLTWTRERGREVGERDRAFISFLEQRSEGMQIGNKESQDWIQ